MGFIIRCLHAENIKGIAVERQGRRAPSGQVMPATPPPRSPRPARRRPVRSQTMRSLAFAAAAPRRSPPGPIRRESGRDVSTPAVHRVMDLTQFRRTARADPRSTLSACCEDRWSSSSCFVGPVGSDSDDRRTRGATQSAFDDRLATGRHRHDEVGAAYRRFRGRRSTRPDAMQFDGLVRQRSARPALRVPPPDNQACRHERARRPARAPGSAPGRHCR